MNTYTPSLPFVTWDDQKEAYVYDAESKVKEMVAAYLEAAIWADKPEDEDWDTTEWEPDSEATAWFECCAFLKLAKWHINDWTMEQLGHDFWLTRNGHGTGFWDRDFGTEESRDALTMLSKVFGECSPYQYKGLLYLS